MNKIMKPNQAPYKRNVVSKQLFSGHLRLDMTNPMTQGNFIVLKGDKRSSGKHNVMQGAINSFLDEDQNNKAIFVSLS
jgi:hypothetical protein